MKLGKYSIGVGDRFGLQGVPQLRAVMMAGEKGVEVTPVWNKSNREHGIIGTAPGDTRREADGAVRDLRWSGAYYVDADHIGARTVDGFIEPCDFFTIDVADEIGLPPESDAVTSFLGSMAPLAGTLRVPGIDTPIVTDEPFLRGVAGRYIRAVKEAGRVYRRILSQKRGKEFVAEVSLDESDVPQSPGELLFILGAIAAEGIPVQTIAPKFTGAFLKGVDYVGDREVFLREFEQNLAVVAFAVRKFHLPEDLKLSVHTGSDKFSLYPLMHDAIRRYDAGLHLKTAGTTWLEEVIGLAEAGGEGLRTAKEIYTRSFERFDELCAPYLQVIRIDRTNLPSPAEAAAWSAEAFAATLRHDLSQPRFNPDFRQLVHVGYKVAAEMGEDFTRLLRRHALRVGENVTHNIYRRHIGPLFAGTDGRD
jgi:hypothetical protein